MHETWFQLWKDLCCVMDNKGSEVQGIQCYNLYVISLAYLLKCYNKGQEYRVLNNVKFISLSHNRLDQSWHGGSPAEREKRRKTTNFFPFKGMIQIYIGQNSLAKTKSHGQTLLQRRLVFGIVVFCWAALCNRNFYYNEKEGINTGIQSLLTSKKILYVPIYKLKLLILTTYQSGRKT